ncbi:hypothetical protein FNQ90_22030 [Streptomyces alkaliphilus]|uniref:Uncharacterized protein n=1 Tax=Streptomyces alkaliphilus TaxID=1472722 RepID=A0A7W3TH63_9ACTN|nr:hypothetical protein [Streptomyces alkaliphilus]MBB0246721.1 hypothetical protein [Streptomyces alkaliphilus]
MTESVPVRCPACGREHAYSPPEYPCVCGAPVSVPVPLGGTAVEIRHRSWEDSWTEVSCRACGADGHWPQPEFICACGATIRLATAEGDAIEETSAPDRPAFRPLTIRTAHDAVACAAQFLCWLGFEDVRPAAPRSANGVDLRGPEIVGAVNPATHPTGARGIETLWLHGLSENAIPIAFSLAGYDRQARSRADELQLPLFVLDLAGTPQPVNDPADLLLRERDPGHRD